MTGALPVVVVCKDADPTTMVNGLGAMITTPQYVWILHNVDSVSIEHRGQSVLVETVTQGGMYEVALASFRRV